MNIKFNIEVVLFYIIENMNPNYNIFPCFIEKKSKTTLKIYAMSKQSLWFSTTSTYSFSSSSLKLYVSSSFFSSNFPEL
jgi:hypothetical protein